MLGPREILEQARALIQEHANGDPDRWWYANRFVFARLMLDERRTKTGIKKRLLAADEPCHYCGKLLTSAKGVHLHRVGQDRGYSDKNCVLMHRDCHQRCHAEEVEQVRAERAEAVEAAPNAKTVLVKKSKLYDDMRFLYWWDITPKVKAGLDRYEAVAFACKDTGLKACISVEGLGGFLTAERQTTRGDGNWGIRVLVGHENELAFEPGTGGGKWLLLPVEWSEE